MPFNNNDDFKYQVKMANPLETVISKYVTLKRSGRNYVCCCPFHSEKTPSFHVNVANGFYKCFGCGESGDVFSFIMKIENLSFFEALKFLAENSGIPMPNLSNTQVNNKFQEEKKILLEINRETARFYCKQLKINKYALNYIINERKLNQDIFWGVFGFGFAPNDNHSLFDYLKSLGYKDDDIFKSGLVKINDKGYPYDFFRNRIIVPILDIKGNVIAFGGRVLDNSQPKYLNSSDTLVFKKSETLFSLNHAKKNIPQDKRYLILAEGYMDVIALYQAGFKNAVASLGTSLTPEQVSLIYRYADGVIICYDSDQAGINATNRAIGLLLNAPSDKDFKIKVLQIKDAKDPDEYIKKFGKDRFNLLLDTSIDAIEFQIQLVEKSVDLKTSQGRIDMLNRCSSILEQISNESSREVYIYDIAKKCNVSADIYRETINNNLTKNHNKISPSNNNYYYNPYNTNQYQYRYNSNVNNFNNTLLQNKSNNEHVEKKMNSERLIIACITKYFDLISYAKDSINFTYFDNYEYLGLNYRTIFKVICEHAETLNTLQDVSILHGELQEMDFICLLNIMNDKIMVITEYENAQTTLIDCIDNILQIKRENDLKSQKGWDLIGLVQEKQYQESLKKEE